MVLTGVMGSSLVMTSSLATGHFSSALYRTTTPRDDPGCSVAGNGLLINFQKQLLRFKPTLFTCRAQSPTLQMVTVRSARQQAFTPPKHSDPVTASLPDGASPETRTARGLDGSLLVTVIVALVGPIAVGSKRIGTARESPAAMVRGYDSTSGTWNSPGPTAMLVTESVHLPLLFRINGSSAKDPRQTLPKRPLLARIRLNRGGGQLPETAILCGPDGSLLNTVIVPLTTPKLPG